MSLLVTGFGPFADQTDNPSGLLARALHGERIAGENVTGVVLPVSGGQAGQELTAVIDGLRPRLVLALGVTPGRSAPALERVAINVRDFPIPDIDGAQQAVRIALTVVAGHAGPDLPLAAGAVG